MVLRTDYTNATVALDVHALAHNDVNAAVNALQAAPAAPVRRAINNQTGTTYTPVLADENKMVTLSNAAAITVTLPSNATTAFPIGAEIEFLWLGVGKPTFTNGSGATLNAAVGKAISARYGKVSAKKIATNDWVLYGNTGT